MATTRMLGQHDLTLEGPLRGAIMGEGEAQIDRSQVFLGVGNIDPAARILVTDDAPPELWGEGQTVTGANFQGAIQTKIQLLSCFSTLSDIPLIMERANPGKLDYKDLFNFLAAEGLCRGQNVAGKPEVRWDQFDKPFIHHVYFPAIAYSQRTRSWTGAGFALFYSNVRPQNAAIGHTPDWRDVEIPGLGYMVSLDVSLVRNNLNAIASILTALATTRPQVKSNIYIVDCNRSTEYEDGSPQIRGASLGLATAMAVLHGPQVAYTGFLRKFPGAATFTGPQGGPAGTLGYPEKFNAQGPIAANTDDIVEEVAGVGTKMAWAIQHDLPLVIPHKSSFNTSMQAIIDRSKTDLTRQSTAMTLGMAQVAYSTTQADMGIPYSAFKSPLLLATTVPEALQLGAFAYISFYIKPVATNRLASWVYNSERILGGFTALTKKQIKAQETAQANKKAYEKDPEEYIKNQELSQKEKLNATTQKMMQGRMEKDAKLKVRIDAKREKAAADKAAKLAKKPVKPSDKRVAWKSALRGNAELVDRQVGFGGKKSKRARSSEPARERERSAPATAPSQPPPAPDDDVPEDAPRPPPPMPREVTAQERAFLAATAVADATDNLLTKVIPEDMKAADIKRKFGDNAMGILQSLEQSIKLVRDGTMSAQSLHDQLTDSPIYKRAAKGLKREYETRVQGIVEQKIEI